MGKRREEQGKRRKEVIAILDVLEWVLRRLRELVGDM